MNELAKLKWPDGWSRTRIDVRKSQGSWKRTLKQSIDALTVELKRNGSTEFVVSYNVLPDDARKDPGVAVYFSKQTTDDHSWQDALEIESPAPTIAEIDAAFKKKALAYHPDREGGDIEIFQMYKQHRDRAVAWVKGTHRADHEFVIPCDKFNEVRLNVNAITLALKALRQLDRVGVPGILERSFQGFRTALPAYEVPESTHV